MKIIDTKKENNKVIMTIKADSELWSKELAKTKKQLAKNLSIPGFRKGHAPQKIIDEHITMNQVISETVNKYVNQLIDKFMSEDVFDFGYIYDDNSIARQVEQFEATFNIA